MSLDTILLTSSSLDLQKLLQLKVKIVDADALFALEPAQFITFLITELKAILIEDERLFSTYLVRRSGFLVPKKEAADYILRVYELIDKIATTMEKSQLEIYYLVSNTPNGVTYH